VCVILRCKWPLPCREACKNICPLCPGITKTSLQAEGGEKVKKPKVMKKIVFPLFLALMLVSSNAAFAKLRIIIITKKGSIDGLHYAEKKEAHANGFHLLQCKNPGYTLCDWDFPPTKIKGISGTEYSVTEIENIAKSFIERKIRETNQEKITNETILFDGIFIKILNAEVNDYGKLNYNLQVTFDE
jgi:hypothetical protein